MLPPKEGWGLFLLWVCAHIGGFTANKVNLPPLLGMLVAGIILRNIPQGQSLYTLLVAVNSQVQSREQSLHMLQRR